MPLIRPVPLAVITPYSPSEFEESVPVKHVEFTSPTAGSVPTPEGITHIPLAVEALPPRSMTSPLKEAVESPIEVGVLVTTVGG